MSSGNSHCEKEGTLQTEVEADSTCIHTLMGWKFEVSKRAGCKLATGVVSVRDHHIRDPVIPLIPFTLEL